MQMKEAFLSCVAVAVAGLFGAPSAIANHGGHGGSCNWTVTVAEGPCSIDNPSQPVCSDSGGYTGIHYQVSGSPADHAAVLVTANNQVYIDGNTQVFPPGSGDPVTGLGAYSEHEQAVKINGVPSSGDFWVIVEGRKSPVPTTVRLKKGYCKESFAVPGLGLDISPFRVDQKVETVKFKECSVDFIYNTLTGELLDARLSDNAPAECNLIKTTVDKLSLTLDPSACDEPNCELGLGQFGEGYISTGENSCTTRIIGGRVYSWGAPCP